MLDFNSGQIREYLDLFVWGELGIYMYRDEEARLVSFHTDNNLESLAWFSSSLDVVSCRFLLCALLPRLDFLLEALDVAL